MVGSRRQVVLGVAAVAVGAAAGAGADLERVAAAERVPLPFWGGYASAVRPDLTPPVCAGGSIHWWGRRGGKQVALTFDDGPHPEWTPRLLDALAAEDAKATFFVKGVNVRDHPAVHAHSVGHHEIANHTWDHPDLGRLDHPAVTAQIARCSDTVEEVLGTRPVLFRPPYGHAGGSTLLAASEAGLPMVLWSAGTRESHFTDRPDGVVPDVLGQLSGGDIIVAHDAGDDSRLILLDRVGAVVRGIRQRGFELVTVSELLAAATVSPVREADHAVTTVSGATRR